MEGHLEEAGVSGIFTPLVLFLAAVVQQSMCFGPNNTQSLFAESQRSSERHIWTFCLSVLLLNGSAARPVSVSGNSLIQDAADWNQITPHPSRTLMEKRVAMDERFLPGRPTALACRFAVCLSNCA